MPRLIRVAGVAEIPEGTGREVLAGDHVVAIFNVGGEFHALDGICPHAGGPLAQGCLQGTIVTCPWHGWQFDITTGRHCLNQYLTHGRFRVEVAGADIFVEIPE